MRFAGLLALFLWAAPADAQRIAPEKFIPSFSQSQNPDCNYSQARVETDVVPYDLLAPTYVIFDQCFRFAPYANSWATLKAYNPDILIFVYANGPPMLTTQLGFPLRVGDEAFVKNNHGIGAADRWVGIGREYGDYLVGSQGDGYDKTLQMNLKNNNWLDWWADSFATWEGRANPYGGPNVTMVGVDGIFGDNFSYPLQPLYRIGFPDQPSVCPTSGTHTGYCDWPADFSLPWYSQTADFHAAIFAAWNRIGARLRTQNLKLIPNGFSLEYTQRWQDQDALANPPFAAMSEGLVASFFGHALITGVEMRNAITTFSNVRNTKALWDNTVRSNRGCATDNSGTYETGITCWELFWYTMGAFLQGFDTQVGNGFFGYATDNNIRFWDELNPAYIHLGNQVGKFVEVQTDLYRREFQDGWVFTNASTGTKSGIAVPSGTARVIDHSNFRNPGSVPFVSSFNLGPTRSVILLKSGRSLTNSDNPIGSSNIGPVITISVPVIQ